MKTDLDSLMQAHNFDALLAFGPGDHNPAMMYLTGGGHFTGELLKKRGAPPVLFCRTMERDEAAKTGLATRLIDDYKPMELLKQFNGDSLKASTARFQQMFADCGVTAGRVVVYGKVEIGGTFALLNALQAAMPGLTFVGETGNTLLMEAQMTKDENEIARIRKMGQITTAVVAQTADFVAGHKTRNEVVIKPDGTPLTIGDVKSRINLWLAERGAENPEGTIFAIGRDSAVPHSSGNPADVLKLGQTIVYDIFPCEQGGGYYYDFTRTWCLGYAPDAALKQYEQVRSVFDTIMSELKSGVVFKRYQERVCDLYEAMGHVTTRQDPGAQEGYIHSLGHGVGLNIHERPASGVTASDADVLAPGAVFTIEPGLYYPDQGIGVRLEDTVWMRPDGVAEVFAPYPLDLVLPMGK